MTKGCSAETFQSASEKQHICQANNFRELGAGWAIRPPFKVLQTEKVHSLERTSSGNLRRAYPDTIAQVEQSAEDRESVCTRNTIIPCGGQSTR